jgi:hypothetical protein
MLLVVESRGPPNAAVACEYLAVVETLVGVESQASRLRIALVHFEPPRYGYYLPSSILLHNKDSFHYHLRTVLSQIRHNGCIIHRNVFEQAFLLPRRALYSPPSLSPHHYGINSRFVTLLPRNPRDFCLHRL